MKNVSSKKGRMTGMTHPHVDPPMIPLIQETNDGKSDRYFIKLKLHRDHTSPTSDLYEFKMSLFDNGQPEELLLFSCNFNMTITASGTVEAGAKCQYLCTPVRRKPLCQFDSLYADIESTQNLNVDDIIKILAQ